jgi:acyl-CoA thioesterase-1
MPARLFLVSFVYLFLCCCAACTDTSAPDNTPTTPTQQDTLPKPPDSLYYLALGDSYTIGERVAAEWRYPVQLVQQLLQVGKPVAAPQIIARTGWTTTQLKSAIAVATLRERYDLVSLLIGVNNQYQRLPQETYRREFRELLETAIQLAGNDTSRVFVLSIPDYAYTPFGQGSNAARISMEIDEYNAINLSIARAYNVIYFDITPISREGLKEPILVASDRLHPSGEMYRRWVALMWGQVATRLP